MTVKELIRNYLSGKGFVLTGDIHNYICSGGHSPFGTGPCLSRMRKSGELLSQGGGHKTAYRLNPDFVPEKSTVRPSAPKPKILQEWKEPMRQAELESNGVFENCRSSSQVYAMDRLLREVRNAANLVRP